MTQEKKYGDKEMNKMANPKNWDIWDAPKQGEIIYQKFPELTCLCPRSSYPDFAKVHLIIIPDKKVVELKCLKLWLNSFRDMGISHENATAKIADTLFDTLKLTYIFVLMEYTPRGNLTTIPMTIRKADGEFIGSTRRLLSLIEAKLINKII